MRWLLCSPAPLVGTSPACATEQKSIGILRVLSWSLSTQGPDTTQFCGCSGCRTLTVGGSTSLQGCSIDAPLGPCIRLSVDPLFQYPLAFCRIYAAGAG